MWAAAVQSALEVPPPAFVGPHGPTSSRLVRPSGMTRLRPE